MATKTVDKTETAEWAKCAVSFKYFLSYVHVLEPPPGGAIIKFVAWPHILELVGLFEDERLIAILKARQIGLSWLLAAYALWTAMFQKGAVVLMLSKSENDASDLLGKSEFIYSQLPDSFRVTVNPSNSSEMGFPSVLSSIEALPATQSAGRSKTATLVICDEHDFHPYAKDNYSALKPTIDAGGQFIAVSTVDKLKLDTHFKALYRGAKDGLNNFVARFFGWNSRPGRGQEWYEKQRKEYSAEPWRLEQEYPASEEEALSPVEGLSAFDFDALRGMKEDCRVPIQTIGPINVYQGYIPGKKYLMGTDTSHGVGSDDAVTVCMDSRTGYIAADIVSNVTSPEDLAYHSVEMWKMFDKPLWGIEDNDWGVLTLRTAQSLGCKNLFHQDWVKDRSKFDKPGWHTGESNRHVLWGELMTAVEARHITIPNEKGLGQFFTVIRNPEKNGRIEGMSGTRDDYPLATGICWQMRHYMNFGGESGKVKHYGEKRRRNGRRDKG